MQLQSTCLQLAKSEQATGEHGPLSHSSSHLCLPPKQEKNLTGKKFLYTRQLSVAQR